MERPAQSPPELPRADFINGFMTPGVLGARRGERGRGATATRSKPAGAHAAPLAPHRATRPAFAPRWRVRPAGRAKRGGAWGAGDFLRGSRRSQKSSAPHAAPGGEVALGGRRRVCLGTRLSSRAPQARPGHSAYHRGGFCAHPGLTKWTARPGFSRRRNWNVLLEWEWDGIGKHLRCCGAGLCGASKTKVPVLCRITLKPGTLQGGLFLGKAPNSYLNLEGLNS